MSTRKRSIKFMAAVTFAIAAVMLMVAWAATVPSMVPDGVNSNNLKGACKYQARASLK